MAPSSQILEPPQNPGRFRVTAGYYVDSGGNGSFVSSNMSAAVNFGTQIVAFSTTGSVTTNNLTLTTPTSNPALNMTGTLIYSASSNQFTGTVNTMTMTGSATGKFYGPAAQEMGGTFSLSGGGTTTYIGGFGGK